jgi:hypothetical protein
MRRLTWARVVLTLVGVMLAGAGSARAAAPTATTNPATGVGSTTATLNATVNVGGNLLPNCYFEYGTTTSYGTTVPCTPAPSGSADETVTATVTGLAPNTTYDFQVVLGTLLGGTVMGGNQSFTTVGPPAPPVVATTSPSGVFSNAATLNGTVNPNGAVVSDCHFAYGTSPSSLDASAPCASTPAGSTAQPVSANLAGLAPATTYYYALSATSTAGSSSTATASFSTTSTAPPAPSATTGAASGIGITDATVSATVDPEGVGVSSCVFEYGTTTSYGQTAPCSPTPSGSGAQSVSALLTGLSAGSDYHVQVVLTTAGGPASGGDVVFTTLPAPAAGTQPASAVTTTTANLRGTVNPLGQAVTGCLFAYGPTPSYGKTVPCSPSNIAGSDPVPVIGVVTGLSGGVTYHFRVVMTTDQGTAVGNDLTFTTPPGPTGSTGAATRIGIHSALLHATVNVHGRRVLRCYFEYGISPFSDVFPFGITGSCAPMPTGSRSTAVSVPLTGLASQTRYYVRIYVTTPAGQLTGSTVTFRTRPTVPRPGVRITAVAAGRGSARFTFASTGPRATRYQCAVAAIRGGRSAPARFRACGSPAVFAHLSRGRYMFLVRAGNAVGFGGVARRPFAI